MGPGSSEGEPAPGRDEVLRIVAGNPSPMTLAGTNTYLVGSDPAVVIDPGPADRAHVDAILARAEDRGGLGGAMLTHAHLDHAGALELLEVPLLWGSTEAIDEASALAEAAASDEIRPTPPSSVPPPFAIDRLLVVPTPGHASDHVCFQLGDVGFCGDLLLGQGSTIVPPRRAGGSLADYMASLDRLDQLGCELLCPGHGDWIEDPPARIREQREHRLDRERRLREALDEGISSRTALLDRVWDDVPAELRGAAALSLHAHLEKLAAEGIEMSVLEGG